MILKCFAVYDSKVSAFMAPFFLRHSGEALRSWEEVVNDGKSAFSNHPADFTLFEIGSYNESTGVLTNLESKVNLGTALEFKRKPAENLVLPLGKKGE